jgi:DNA-binding CsgD family transcriptional regulator
VHRALADVTDPRLDPDRRAWHRARGTKAVNEDVAHELERSAGAAQSRGGFAAAGAFLTRAAELTPDSARRSRRALRAAFVDVQAGAFDAARRMLTIAGDGPGSPLQRARIDLAAAQLAFASSRRTEASARLLAAARRLERLDVDLARETYLDAMSAALFGARRDRRPGAAEIVRAARAAPRPTAQVTAADLLLDGLVALADDYRTAVPLCRIAVRALADGRNLPPAQLRRLWQGCVVALELWDDDCAHTLSAHHVDLARRAGALSELALAIGSATPLLVLRGDLAGAASIMTEGRSVEDATGISSAPHASAIVAAWRGHAREAQHLIADSIDRATSRGEAVAVAMGEYASAVVANSLGDYDAGVRAGRRATHDREIVVENWGLSELVESASRTGQLDLARNASDRLAEKASAAGTDWALGVARRSEALVSDTTRAEELYRESIERLRRTRIRAELARAHLLFGEWLRRTHRPADARSELQTALDLFRDMDMDGFAERARRELLATGAKVRKRSVETNHDLTAQEAQIARLAGNGLSNPEIAAQLFISSRTVEWHLRKVFMKLGITSRRQLRTPFGPGATTTG